MNAIKGDADHVPVVLIYDARGNGDGKICPTTTGDHQNRVTDYTALVVTESPSSSGTMNTGAHPGSYNGQDAYSDMLITGENHEHQIYMSDRKGHSGMTDDGSATTLNAQEKERPMISKKIVRRLTPTECMRLQGYPDGWLDIGEDRIVRKNDYETTWEETENSRWPTEEEYETDERLYDDDGNLDMSAYGFKKKRKKIGSHQEIVPVWVDENGKSHEESDTQKYKAAGNSIALPFWSWLYRRIAAQYERQATMGSLFDGIGGFPLTAIRNGVKPLWASEIEAFPIAVCKKHFGDEDAGIEGDVMNFL